MPPRISPLPGSPQSAPDGHPADSESALAESTAEEAEPFQLTPRPVAPIPGTLPFGGGPGEFNSFDQQVLGRAAAILLPAEETGNGCGSALPNGNHAPGTAAQTALVEAEQAATNLNHLGSLRPLGQLRESFILAAGDDGLWIIDQHVAHERVLFEKILRDRQVEKVQRQRLLMPLLVELKPWQMVIFAQIAEELESNGFEVEPFGPQTLAVKSAPVGLEGAALERMLAQVIEQSGADSEQVINNKQLASLRTRIAASIACHSAIKVNTALDLVRMEWLLLELSKTEHPTSCPHGRPIALLYSWKDIERAFHRI
jgi:DNA mismatch repair protein MutL